MPPMPKALSPIADPVVEAMFSSVESAGLAAQSLIGAILAEDGASIGKVIEVTPQRAYALPNERGCRVDIKTATEANEVTFTEVQLVADSTIIVRDLFDASRVYSETSSPGTTHAELAARMPRVIAINILGYTLRDDSVDILQPAKLLYTKPPQRVASDKFASYSIQLPSVEKVAPDFSSPFYCWCYCEAN